MGAVTGHAASGAPVTPETLAKLATFDTPTIANIIELFTIRPNSTGFTDARIRACFPEMPAIVGFAATATFRASDPPRAGIAYASLADQVEAFADLSGPPIVVFQDLDEPATAATFGEVMCSTYQAFGAVGLVTSGAGRDLDQVQAIGFPVFTNGTIAAHGYCHTPSIHVPVRIGGLTVHPNDMLHADRNGICLIPTYIASEVAAIGDEFVAAEQIVLDAVRTREPSVRTLREAARACDAEVSRLRSRIVRHATG
jgi:regulator of RNase E activity RraA